MSSRNNSKPEAISEQRALKIAEICRNRASKGFFEVAEARLFDAMTDVAPTSFAYVALRAAMDEVQATPRGNV